MRMRRGRQFERSPRRPGSSSVEGSSGQPARQPARSRAAREGGLGLVMHSLGPIAMIATDGRARRGPGRQADRQAGSGLSPSSAAESRAAGRDSGVLVFAAAWHRAAVPRERGRRATLLAALHSKYRRRQAGAPAADLQQRTPQALRQDRHMPEADRRYREALKSQRPRPALASVAAQPAFCSGTCAGAGRRVVPGRELCSSMVSTSGDDGCCCCVHDPAMGRRTSKRALKHVITCGAASWAAGP